MIVDLAAMLSAHRGEGHSMGRKAWSTAFAAGVVVVLTVPLLVSVGADATADVLLSRQRPVIASSTAGAAFAASNAADGKTATRWTSANGPGTQWLRIDLGRAQQINRVRLLWQSAYARSYRLQVSADGSTWSNIYTTQHGDGGTDDLRKLDGNGRYLRVLAMQRAGAQGYSLWEVQAYGPGRAAPSAPLWPESPTSSPQPTPSNGPFVPPLAAGLDDPEKKNLAMQLVSSAENSTLDWRGQFGYIEDINDGRGYTGGIIGFCSGTSDMLALVQEYTKRVPGNVLAHYIPALKSVDGSDSHAGLDPDFVRDWKIAAADPVFQQSQEDERDRGYFNPAIAIAKSDGVRALGQFAYYDAAVMHGIDGLRAIRAAALQVAKTPSQNGDEVIWLNAFLDARVMEMRTEPEHHDTSRVDTAQRGFLRAGNLDLNAPLRWSVYGDRYTINR